MHAYRGFVVSIYIAPVAAAPARSVTEVRAVPGRGLEGDRYFAEAGTFSHKKKPWNEATFIEIEAIEAIARDYGISLSPSDTRRNIITRGVALNHLVGRTFRVGAARFEGLRLCEPCGHLEKLTREGVKQALLHRGGLRARVLAAGVFRAGDEVREEEEEEEAP